jgi:LCP family protein required for cell wall assembly
MKLWAKIVLGIFLVLSGATGFFAAKAQVRVEQSMQNVTHTYDTSLAKVDLGDIQVNSDNNIVNILILGNDARMESYGKEGGLSDVMMIGTLDKKHKCLKLTSLMRDIYVEIPGHGYNKLNAAYPLGGVELLYQTIAQNFGIKLDGYVEIGFESFVKIVNDVGGVDIEISDSEASYLNSTNYIHGLKNRNLVPGWNHMNGYQALGLLPYP